MPAQPSWIHRLPDIRAQVEQPHAPLWWDRSAVETLFGLRRRQAIALLHQLGAQRIGTGLAVERAALLRFLEDPRRRAASGDEHDRSARVAIALGKARGDLAGRRISIPTSYDPDRIDFAGLPAGIDLERQQLRISFASPTELLEKLFALGQALANDYETFETAWREKDSA